MPKPGNELELDIELRYGDKNELIISTFTRVLQVQINERNPLNRLIKEGLEFNERLIWPVITSSCFGL